jgi:hypothetical protein
MAGELLELCRKVIEMVLSLREEDRGTALVESLDDVIEDEPITLLVGREQRVQLLNA